MAIAAKRLSHYLTNQLPNYPTFQLSNYQIHISLFALTGVPGADYWGFTSAVCLLLTLGKLGRQASSVFDPG